MTCEHTEMLSAYQKNAKPKGKGPAQIWAQNIDLRVLSRKEMKGLPFCASIFPSFC